MKKIVTKIGQVLFYTLKVLIAKPIVKKEEIDRESLAYINDNVAQDKVIVKVKTMSYPRWYLPFYWLFILISFLFIFLMVAFLLL